MLCLMAREPAGCDHPQGSAVGQYECWKDGTSSVHFRVEEWPEWKKRRLAELLFEGLDSACNGTPDSPAPTNE